MPRYIDVDKLLTDETIRVMPHQCGKAAGRTFVFFDDIEKAPTADVVEVVRCRSCIYSKESKKTNIHYCAWHGEYFEIYPEDFCSYGVREK